jgi:hypothetical protein
MLSVERNRVAQLRGSAQHDVESHIQWLRERIKVALVTGMHKLITILNAMLKHNTTWQFCDPIVPVTS